MAFDERVFFEPQSKKGGTSHPYSEIGTLCIPLNGGESQKPGWIVDGQQRAAAIREARIDSFPITVTAFITENTQEQREQFILVNSTKPLPKGLIYELLPGTEVRLSSILERKRFPSYLAERLNYDDESPLYKMIKTPTNPLGVIKDNSILKFLENSLSDGALYRFRDPKTRRGDVDRMISLVMNFWHAVSEVFDNAWNLPPTRSRMMHGAGVVSLGFLMDAISDRIREQVIPSSDAFARDLRPLRDSCRWTSGYWDFGPGAQRKWNEIQNVPKDIQLLSNYLLVQYKEKVWDFN